MWQLPYFCGTFPPLRTRSWLSLCTLQLHTSACDRVHRRTSPPMPAVALSHAGHLSLILFRTQHQGLTTTLPTPHEFYAKCCLACLRVHTTIPGVSTVCHPQVSAPPGKLHSQSSLVLGSCLCDCGHSDTLSSDCYCQKGTVDIATHSGHGEN